MHQHRYMFRGTKNDRNNEITPDPDHAHVSSSNDSPVFFTVRSFGTNRSRDGWTWTSLSRRSVLHQIHMTAITTHWICVYHLRSTSPDLMLVSFRVSLLLLPPASPRCLRWLGPLAPRVGVRLSTCSPGGQVSVHAMMNLQLHFFFYKMLMKQMEKQSVDKSSATFFW